MSSSNLKKINHFKLTPIRDVSLHRNLIGAFTCILAFSLLIYIVIIYPLDGDKASSLASMFGFAATLFAPIAALFLLDNWKVQKKYEIVSTLAIEAHREFIYAKDKYMFFLFQHIYGTPVITYNEVDDDLFKVIAKLNLLDAILERFQFGIRINSEINNTYKEGYCKIPVYYRDVNDLKRFGETQLKMVFDKAFAGDNELFKKLLDIIEKVENKN